MVAPRPPTRSNCGNVDGNGRTFRKGHRVDRLRRPAARDGTIAYNLVVVVDDAYQGVNQVVRADDLLSSAPTQAYIAHVLGLPEPTYVHVPLVVNEDGARLAKRDGAVTLRELLTLGWSVEDVVGAISESLGFEARTVQELLQVFGP